MDNYNNENNQNSYGSEGYSTYRVDPDNNSYRYTGTETDTSNTAGGSYSTYGARTESEADQSRSRYYSPYERRTMAENASYSNTAQKKKKKRGFGVTVAKCACLAAVFGLVAGGIFGGVNYLIPQKDTAAVAVEDTQTPALTTSTQEAEQSTTTAGSGIVATDVSAIVEEVMPSIVAITNMTEIEYRTWFGQTYSEESDSAGSGIIVSEDDDYLYIATNNHVVADATTLIVQFCDDSTATAEIKGTSESNDLAVVQVDKASLSDETKAAIKIATINSEGNEKVGQAVIAIGNALGYGQSVTSGIISALEREITAEDSTTGQTYTNTLTQTDASINPGNSGGALLNVNGEVIGINSSKIGGDYVDGVGFAIPMTIAAPIIENLITREKVSEDKAAYLGVVGVDVDEEIAATYNMPTGICITMVYEGTAAAKAGIQKGDIITAFDGQEISSMEELQELMQYHAAGSEVTITVARADNGQYVEMELDVTLGSKD